MVPFIDTQTDALLSVRDLSVKLFTRSATVYPVNHVSYDVKQGETLAIVGESGSGKTVLNFAPLGLMSRGVTTDISGSIILAGKQLVGMDEPALRAIRGKEIGVIFQDPMSALNPARQIGRQIAEVSELHNGLSSAAAETRALDLLRMVGIPDAPARLRQYPHELSGGLRQRVMIAIAVAAEPKLLIADEPTTALDVTIQAQILELLKDLQHRLRMSIVLITHDIGVVAGMAQRVAVMYAGRVVEYGDADEVLVKPSHPYTTALLSSIPDPQDPVGSPFRGLGGAPPNLMRRTPGCAFATRCSSTINDCRDIQPILRPVGKHSTLSACHVAAGRA